MTFIIDIFQFYFKIQQKQNKIKRNIRNAAFLLIYKVLRYLNDILKFFFKDLSQKFNKSGTFSREKLTTRRYDTTIYRLS